MKMCGAHTYIAVLSPIASSSRLVSKVGKVQTGEKPKKHCLKTPTSLTKTRREKSYSFHEVQFKINTLIELAIFDTMTTNQL